MRFLMLGGLIMVALTASAQLEYLPLQLTTSERGRIENFSLDTLALPFWDDFASSNTLDSALWASGIDVFINNTQSIQAPSKNVASFDGLNQLGFPHLEESEFNGLGDSLASHAVDLSSLTDEDRNSVYFSFYWQMKGWGDLPDDEDSLQLQFLGADSIWYTQDINPDPDHYGLTGSLSNLVFDEDSIQSFTQVILPVTEQFHHPGFRFKFQSYTSLNGIYDTWHIDYIYLNKNRSANDKLHFDRTLSSTEKALFSPYVALPLDQLTARSSEFISQESFAFSNLDNSPHPARYSYQIKELISGSRTENIFVTPPDMLPLELGRIEQVPFTSLPDLNGDSLILQTEITYLTGDKRLFEEVDTNGDTVFLTPDLTVNDTVRNQYILHNYLAYDDGTAEIAAGINLNQGQMAVQYVVAVQDTLTDILIYFPPIFPSTVGESITLKVWNDLDNLALAREFGGVIEPSQRNQFQQFTLQTPLIVRDTFYLGFQQFTDNYIGVGLDKNNNGGSSSIYTNTNREWTQNDRISGSLMIRPVFRSAAQYVLSTARHDKEITFYPNPAVTGITLSEKVVKATIYSLSGSVLMTKNDCQSLDVTGLTKGVYLLTLQHKSNGALTTEQLIIQ